MALCSESIGPYPPLPGGLHDEGAGHDQDLLRRQGDLLAGFERVQGRRQGTSARYRDDHEVASRVGHHRLDPGVEIGLARLALDEVLGGALGRPASLGQAEELQARGVAVDDVEGLLADRSGRTQDRHVDRAVTCRRWNNVT